MLSTNTQYLRSELEKNFFVLVADKMCPGVREPFGGTPPQIVLGTRKSVLVAAQPVRPLFFQPCLRLRNLNLYKVLVFDVQEIFTELGRKFIERVTKFSELE